MAYTNNDIYNFVNFIIRKDSKGQPLTRSNFSLLLDTNGLEYFEIMYDDYERTQEMSDSLKRFKVTKQGAQLSFTGNTIDIPTNYAHAGFLYHKKNGTDVKPIYLVDDDKFMLRQNSAIEVPTVDYPTARFITDYIEYLPTSLDQNNFTFSYLRYPTTPVYDYYIDANGVLQYLAVGEGHIWSDGEEDSSGNVRSSGSVSVSTSGYDYISQTVELDFNEEDKLKVVYRILQAVGVPIDEAGVYQYAQQLKVES